MNVQTLCLEANESEMEVVRVGFKCKKCNHTWGMNLTDGELPDTWNVCMNCARKSFKKETGDRKNYEEIEGRPE